LKISLAIRKGQMLNCSIGAPFTITQTYKDEGDIKKVSLQLTQSQ